MTRLFISCSPQEIGSRFFVLRSLISIVKSKGVWNVKNRYWINTTILYLYFCSQNNYAFKWINFPEIGFKQKDRCLFRVDFFLYKRVLSFFIPIFFDANWSKNTKWQFYMKMRFGFICKWLEAILLGQNTSNIFLIEKSIFYCDKKNLLIIKVICIIRGLLKIFFDKSYLFVN